MERIISKRAFTSEKRSSSGGEIAKRSRGYSLMEILVTVSIILVTTVIAIPLVQSASTAYQVRSAVNAVTSTIQATRYQAISNGYPFRIAMTKSSSTFQVWNSTCGYTSPCWAKVGSAVPLSGSSVAATLSQDTTLDFRGGGAVVASTGALNFTLTYKGVVETITVSAYGNISVSP